MLPSEYKIEGRLSTEEDVKHLLGRVLTIIDASISDIEQKKAVKDLIKEEIWGNYSRGYESSVTIKEATGK